MKHYLETLPVYPVAEKPPAGLRRVINLASNENTSQPSSAIKETIIKDFDTANRYSDTRCEAVVAALAEHYNISPQKIVCGNGSAELIFLLAQIFAGEDDEVLIWKYGYPLYATAAKRVGANIRHANTAEFIDIDALLNTVTSRTRIVFLDNPNNPTGAYLNLQGLQYLREQLRKDIILVIDAAYAEYVTATDYIDGIQLIENYDNVCVLKTFSKIYGLAGLRIGWLAAKENVINVVRAIQQPASVSHIAQHAALVALTETTRVTQLRHTNKILRQKFIADMQALNLKPYPSQANFVLVNFATTYNAVNVFHELKQAGILVRPVNYPSLKHCLRFTIGTPEEMGVVTQVVSAIVK